MAPNRYEEWVAGYVRAWNSNDPDEIGALFSDNARYLTEPYAEAWTGRPAIVAGWLEAKDEPGDTEFDFEMLVDSDALGIVKGNTLYRATTREYSNLWEIRLDERGRCTEFVEWWMEKKK